VNCATSPTTEIVIEEAIFLALYNVKVKQNVLLKHLHVKHLQPPPQKEKETKEKKMKIKPAVGSGNVFGVVGYLM